jgi:hypothetical protein
MRTAFMQHLLPALLSMSLLICVGCGDRIAKGFEELPLR